MSRVLLYDLETTGDKPQRHRIMQFAGLACDALTLDIVEEFEVKVHFDHRLAYELEALANNVFGHTLYPEGVPRGEPSKDFPRGMPLFAKGDSARWNALGVPSVAARLQVDAFIRRHSTVQCESKRTGRAYKTARSGGHNVATFDSQFMSAWYEGKFVPLGFKLLDTLQLASWVEYLLDPVACGSRDAELNMKALCEKHGIPLIGAHDALVDVHANRKLVLALREELRRELPKVTAW